MDGLEDIIPPTHPHYTSPPHPHKRYSVRKQAYVQCVYVIALVIWVIIVVSVVGLFQCDWLGLLILALPLIVFGLGFANAGELTPAVEESVFAADFLSVGLLLVFPLLVWINKDYSGDKHRFATILVLAVIFTLLSLLDFWVRRRWLSVVKHMKSALQTMSLTLLVYALYIYYIGRSSEALTSTS